MTEQATTELVPEWDMSDRLRKALTHAGISSNEMAEYLEVTRHTISNWINGRTRPPATAVKLWAMRCGVPYEWIAHGIVPSNQPDAERSNITRIMGDQPIDNEITSQAKRVDALREQLHGPARRGPLRRAAAAGGED